MSDEQPSYTTPSTPPTLEEQLAQLQEDLGDAKDAQTEANSTVTDLEQRITALTTLQGEIGQAESDYTDAHPELAENEQACREYLDYETKCLTEILGTATATVGDTVTTHESELSAAQQAVDDAKTTLERLEGELSDADEDRQEANAAADALKNMVATIESRLGSLDAIKTDVNAAHEDTHYALAYWLLTYGDFEEILNGDPALIDPDELADALHAAVNAASDAEEAHAAKELEVTGQQAALVEAEAALETLTKNSDESLREALKDIKPAPAPAPTEPTPSY